MKRTFLLFVLLFIGCDKNNSPTSSSYIDDEYHRQLILKKNKMGQDFLFETKGNGTEQHYVKYLGNIITTKNDTFKIVTSARYTGIYEDAKRGNGKLYVYTADNTLKGYYDLGSVNALPNEIENQEMLVFNYFNNENCGQLTKINVRYPQEYFCPL